MIEITQEFLGPESVIVVLGKGEYW